MGEEYGRSVLSVQMDFTDDASMERAMAEVTEVREQLISEVPLGRFARPDEIASAVAWWVATASFVAGATISVTGGAAMGS